MSKHSIVLHLDEPWYNALSRQLKKENMTVEEKLDEYLDTMINQLPERVYKKVSREVWEEHQADHQASAPDAGQEEWAAQESGKVVRLSDILPLLPDGGRSFLCHRDTKESVLAENLRQLTDTGREDFSSLLNTEVSQIVPTPEGTEVMLTGVEPEELVRFNESFGAFQEAEQAMDTDHFVSVEVYLHEYKMEALEAALDAEGTDVNHYMQDCLIDLYAEMVPEETRQEIRERIDSEYTAGSLEAEQTMWSM